MKRMRIQVTALLLAAIVASVSAPLALAASRQELDRDAAQALKNLYANNTAARLLGQKAKAVLVFPNIVKAGFMFGGQIGEGVLMKDGRPVGYYNSVAASYGLQAGRPGLRLRALLHERRRALLSRQERRLGARRRAEHRRRRCGRRQVAHQHDDHAGRLCLHLRSEGADGRPRHSGLEDHEDLEVGSGDARATADEEGSQHHVEDTPLARGRC